MSNTKDGPPVKWAITQNPAQIITPPSKELKEVYIGEGRSIYVDTDSPKTVKVFDAFKAMQLFAENHPCDFFTGMRRDWYFTAQRVQSIKDIEDNLSHSVWDTPIVSINGVQHDCFVEIDRMHHALVFENGRQRERSRFRLFFRILERTPNLLTWEDLQKLQKEIEKITEKYRSKMKEEDKNPCTTIGKEYQQIIEAKQCDPYKT